MANPEHDKDMVRRLTEDHYFRHLIQQQARETAEASVESRLRTWKWLAGFVSAVLLVAGYEVKSTFNEAQSALENAKRAAGEAEKRLAELDAAAKTAEHIRQQAEGASQGARDVINDARSTAAQIRAESDRDRQTTIEMARLVREGLTTQNQSAGMTAAKNSQTAAALEKRQKEIQSQATTIQGLLAQVGDRFPDFESKLKRAEALNGELEKAREHLVKERQIFEQIARAQNWGLVMIRARSWAQLELADPSDSKVRYRMWFYSSGITPPLDLDLATERLDGKSPASKAQLRGLVQGRCMALADTPFFLRVDFVYHAKFSSDFVALRVLSSREACESQASAPAQ